MFLNEVAHPLVSKPINIDITMYDMLQFLLPPMSLDLKCHLHGSRHADGVHRMCVILIY